MSKQKTPDTARPNELQGEGNYTAAKEYDDATRDFVKSGKVEQAAREAQPKNAQEEREMLEAEEKGRSRAKSEGKTSPGSNRNVKNHNSLHGR